MTGEEKRFTTVARATGQGQASVSAEGRPEIHIARQAEAISENGSYTPEDLFVAAGTACFVNSFVYFMKKMRIEFRSIEVRAVGVLGQVDRSFEITRVESHFRVVIGPDTPVERVRRALELGAKYCFVANSMKCPTHYEHEVVVDRGA